MALCDLTHANFDELTDAHTLVLIDFWAKWCAPCKAFAPLFGAAAQRFPQILFGRVDTDLEPELSQQFEVRSLPTLLAVCHGEIIATRLGALTSEKLDQLIEEMLRKSHDVAPGVLE